MSHTLSYDEWVVVTALREQAKKGSPYNTASQLAAVLGWTEGAVTVVMRTLVAKGAVDSCGTAWRART